MTIEMLPGRVKLTQELKQLRKTDYIKYVTEYQKLYRLDNDKTKDINYPKELSKACAMTTKKVNY